ncbi:outer membrane receptor protein involved in Fe transport [Gillisia mitskevichiae]|uniref:Outer membrane receptor protein involved in Fe transport n=1 Tax=Gillisia mitskevichiae TaxID=270921 RepID=A0A495PTV6_9FLAO|nr:TonB-dependent receptor plug domain-containing protein [Gillisia mitskevichiae]RKS53406.1 outer membrane receptor protein involved in Fe transport [Gillisia mitskevichiae]
MKYIITIFIILFTHVLFAQKIEGIVVSSNNQPLENVAIFNKNTGQHSHSDASGSFNLSKSNLKDSVYFSNLGYKTKLAIISAENIDQPFTLVMEESSISLEQVVLVSEVNALSRLMEIDIQTNPVKSSQEILRKVPGLIIGQHAGGGKAEQIFLRGFDVDHGTDIAISVDGLPVNMVSHAHGQGYADLHFVIPETIENLNFGKGPFYSDKGNFNTAGYINLQLKKDLDKNLISLEAGQFNSKRLVSMFKLVESGNSKAYVASELSLSDGPFDSPQNFNRINIIGRYNYNLIGDQELTITASHFQSKWDASGQIPQRAIDQNLIGRFGAIDDTEGGNTSRSNLLINHFKRIDGNSVIKSKAFISQYDFELYSNFTFFLEDPVNGDQIRQKENRVLIGAESVFERKNIDLGSNGELEYASGIGFRYDKVNDVELSSTLNRQTTLNQISYGDIDEVNTYAFLNTKFKLGKWTLNPALRLDYFKFDYLNKITPTYNNQSETKFAFSPKLNTIYSVNRDWQLFLKSGIGFHSNDARVVVANDGRSILPAAYGLDFGTIFKPVQKLALNAALWSLFLDQEFVYVGDAGIVEPSGKTRRLGIELGARYQARDWLYLYTDVNYTYARSTEQTKGQDFIPLSPSFTSSGGIGINDLNGFSGGLTYRFVDNRPANEDNSIVAEGYFITDLNVSYNWKNWSYGIIVENIFNTEWNETQFATESRLFNESAPVEEIHFTPGTPFFLRGKLAVTF